MCAGASTWWSIYQVQGRGISVTIKANMLKFLHQVKATAENVNEAVRELPDANLVRYSFLFILICIKYFHVCNMNLFDQISVDVWNKI